MTTSSAGPPRRTSTATLEASLCLEARKAALTIALARPPLPALHPQMVFRQKASARRWQNMTNSETRRGGPCEVFCSRSSFARRRIVASDGNLGAMFAAARHRAASGGQYCWLGRDLNPRPLGYEPNELPDYSTPRHRWERNVCSITRSINAPPIVSTWSARIATARISQEISHRLMESPSGRYLNSQFAGIRRRHCSSCS